MQTSINVSLKIKSSAQAHKLHRELKSCWSDESHLTQKILIYIAELLEKQAQGGARRSARAVPK